MQIRGLTSKSLLGCLQRTLNSLNNREYVYADWDRCTCGHVYRGVTRHRSIAKWARTSSNARYRMVLSEIVRANSEYVSLTEWDEADAISHATNEYARTMGCTRRHAAIRLVERTIKMIEVEQEQERLDVLLQAAQVIDNVEIEEPQVASVA